MKLVRYGPRGREKPGLIAADGTLRDLSAHVDDMIFSCAEIVSHVSRFMALRPGDVICTGTPQGVGMGRGRFLRLGDRVTLGVDGLGRQEQTVIATT